MIIPDETSFNNECELACELAKQRYKLLCETKEQIKQMELTMDRRKESLKLSFKNCNGDLNRFITLLLVSELL